MAGATIPSVITYPLIRKLGTGQILTYEEIQQIADLINWAIAELYLDPVFEEGLNSGYGEDTTGAAITQMQWRIPTLHDAQIELRVQVELECTTDDATISFTAAGSGTTVAILPVSSAGRNWWNKDLAIDADADYEDVEMEVDPGTGTVTIYAVRGAFLPLASPLLTQRYGIEGAGADPTYITPVPLSPTPLTGADQPLSAGLGRLLLHDLEQALTRLKRSYYCLSAWGDTSLSSTFLLCPLGVLPRNYPMTKVRTWPGLVARGMKAVVHALVVPDTVDITFLVVLAENVVSDEFRALAPDDGYVFTRVVLRESVASDPTATPVWVSAEIDLPDDIYEPGRPLPAVRLGIRPPYALGEYYDNETTTCGVQTISVWGVW